MTKQEYKNLKIGDKVRINDVGGAMRYTHLKIGDIVTIKNKFDDSGTQFVEIYEYTTKAECRTSRFVIYCVKNCPNYLKDDYNTII